MVQLDPEKLAKLKKLSIQLKNVGSFGPKVDVAEIVEETRRRGAKLKKK